MLQQAFWLIHMAVAQAVLIAIALVTVWAIVQLWRCALWIEED
jgi:hypothetical protein